MNEKEYAKRRKDLLRVLMHEKYDLDICMMTNHVGWCIVAFFYIFFDGLSHGIQSVNREIFNESVVSVFLMFFASIVCATLHLTNMMFVRKPLVRFNIYSVSFIWGATMSFSFMQVYGITNTISMFYIVWFVLIPLRKMYQIVTDAKDQYCLSLKQNTSEEVVEK